MRAYSTSDLSINLFGSMEVKREGKSVIGLRQKSKWLLAYLVLQRGKEIEYDVLAPLLWPDPADKKQTIISLRQCVSNLNLLLGIERFTKTTRSVIGIDLTQIYVDVFAFEAAIKKGDSASLQQAVDLYTGDLLADCPEDWIQADRELRRQAYHGAIETLIEQARKMGNLGMEERYLRLAITKDGLKEANRCNLMRLLKRRGEYNLALEVYKQYRKLQEDPTEGVGPEMKGLLESIKAKVKKTDGALHLSISSSAPQTYRLPRPDRAMVGREEAMDEVASLFLFGRLVTLKGSPGIGKTHLALHIAAHLREDYPDGAVFLDLTDVKSPRDLWRTLTTVLRIPDQHHRSVEEIVCDYLERRQMLLVLDNCEHLIHSVAGIVREILQECPYIRILATSRTAWGTIPGERIYTVKPLSLPAAALLKRLPADPLPELNAFAAIRLFLERVSEIHSTFVLTSESARVVAQICHLLDGVPLAILLAAGWIHTLTPEQIRDHLSKGLELLRTPRLTASVPQDRLMMTLETSYQALTPSLQTLFRRLSLFHGGWTLQSAEDLCQTPYILDSLRQLQEYSLVEAKQDGSEMRFRLLGILRQFGGRLLTQSAEADTMRHRHLDLFMRISEAAAPELIGPLQAATLARLDREANNLTAALAWASESRETTKGLRMAGALWRYFYVRGHYQEGLFWLGRLLRQEPVETGPVRAKALNGAGNLAFQSQDYRQAQAWFQERREFEEAHESQRTLAGALGSLANVTSELGDYAQARTLFERSLAYFLELKDQHGIFMTKGNLAVVSRRQGELSEACALHEECADFFRSVGDRNHLAIALNNSADIRLTRRISPELPVCWRKVWTSDAIWRADTPLPIVWSFLFFCWHSVMLRSRLPYCSEQRKRFWERTQLPLPSSADEEYRRNVERVRIGFGAETFKSLCARGDLMTLEETIAFALVSLNTASLP